ncbi:tyrosinase central domain protein [Neofusicoccum parvum]|uniref:Tyrosinase central domain protein n=1 Tax=Neofusicoccum parvum TaxID=310453 RepID=A0ACB5SKY8_9PEZI|nr:tyrosinase central domain protein [Neofusicoccum parvum]
MTVNFAPVNMALLNGKTIESTNKFDCQPRCLKGNLMDDAIKRFANDTSVSTLLADPQDIAAFQDMMQGNTNRPDMGVHGGGHYSLGGDPSLDQFVSPGDPAFFTHHSMIDRVWWIWQMQNPESRASTASAVAGPYTLQDLYEPHRNGTVDDVLDLGYIVEGKNFRIEQLLSTTDGPFCYVYI